MSDAAIEKAAKNVAQSEGRWPAKEVKEYDKTVTKEFLKRQDAYEAARGLMTLAQLDNDWVMCGYWLAVSHVADIKRQGLRK